MTVTEWLVRLDGLGFQAVRMLLTILWQSSIVFVAAIALTRVLDRFSASIRFTLWVCAVLAVPLILPLHAGMEYLDTPRTQIEIIPEYHDPPPPERDGESPGSHSPAGRVMVFESTDSPPFPPLINFELRAEYEPGRPTVFERISSAALIPFRYPWAFALVFYAAAVMILLMIIARGWIDLVRMIGSGGGPIDPRCAEAFGFAAERLGMKRHPEMFVSEDIDVPMSMGFFNHYICIPEGFADGLSDFELRSIAFHELSHVHRRDPLILSLVSLVRAVFFFHPFLWVASRQVSHFAEQSCDDAVIEHGSDPLQYARLLVRLAESLPERALRHELAAGFLFSRTSFFHRVEAILADRREQFKKLSRTALAGILLTASFSLLTALALPLGERRTAPDSDLLVSGVVSYQGTPVSDAKIYHVTGDYWFFDTATKKRSAVTDGRGRFEVLVRNSGTRVRRKPDYIVAVHESRSMGWVRLDSEPPEDRCTVTIPLMPSGRITGRLTDDGGEPVADAVVAIRNLTMSATWERRSASLYLNGLIPGLFTRTSSDGSFSLDTVPFESTAGMYMEGRGYARNVRYGVQPSSHIGAVLEPGSEIGGRVVVKETGEPAANTRVFARADGYETESSGLGSAITGEDGRYCIQNLPAGIYTVYAAAQQAPHLVATPVEHLRLTAGETAEADDIVLSMGGLVEGRILDADTGEPIVNHHVSLKKVDRRYLIDETVTDRDGFYRLHSMPGEVNIEVSAPDAYIREYRRRRVSIREDDPPVRVDLAFKRGAVLEGRTVTTGGDPVEGAELSSLRNAIHATSGANGRFRISGLPPGESLSLTAIHKDKMLRGFLVLEEITGGQVEVVLEPYESIDVDGCVVDGNGDAVTGMEIHLLSWDHVKQTGISRISSISGKNGAFTINGLIVGEEYFLSCAMLKKGRLRIVAEKNMGPVTLTMPNMDRWISGRTVDGNGEPVPGVRVIINGGPSGFRTAMSDADGWFDLERLAGHTETVAFNHESCGHHVFKNIPTNRERDFVLQRAERWLEGRVVDSSGQPLFGVSVTADQTGQGGRSGHHNIGTRTDPSGFFRLDGLVGRTEVIKLHHADFEPMEIKDVVTNRSDVVFTLESSTRTN